MTPSIFSALEKFTVERVEKVTQAGLEKVVPLDAVSQPLGDVLERRLSEGREVEQAQAKFKEVRRWLEAKEINPRYNPFTPYGSNCGSCAVAVWHRLTGANPEARAIQKNIAPEDEDMALVTGLKVKYMKPEEIEAILRAKGPGSHMICGINRSHGAGHWFNAYFDGKDVKTLDGQVGKVFEWPHDYGKVTEWCALV